MTDPYYEDNHVRIYHADCRDILPELEPVDLVLTDPPYSFGRQEGEFCASGNIACSLHIASEKAPTVIIFGTSSGRGIEFIRSSVRALPHNRVLCWNRSYVKCRAAGPWRWDLVLIHVFGRGSFGKPEYSSLIRTDGTQSLAKQTGHRSPVPTGVMRWLCKPFMPCIVLDPFMGSGSTLIATKEEGGKAIGIEIEEKYCEIAAKRMDQEVLF